MTLHVHHVNLRLTLSLLSPLFPYADFTVALLPAKDSLKAEFQSVPSAAAVKEDVLLPPEGAIATEEGEAEDGKLLKNNLTEDKEDELMGLHEEGAKTEGNEFVFLDFRNKFNIRACLHKFSSPFSSSTFFFLARLR